MLAGHIAANSNFRLGAAGGLSCRHHASTRTWAIAIRQGRSDGDGESTSATSDERYLLDPSTVDKLFASAYRGRDGAFARIPCPPRHVLNDW